MAYGRALGQEEADRMREERRRAKEMDVWSHIAATSKDPKIAAKAFGNLGKELGDIDFSESVTTRMEEMQSQMKEIRAQQGKVPDDAFLSLVEDFKGEYGTRPISEEAETGVRERIKEERGLETFKKKEMFKAGLEDKVKPVEYRAWFNMGRQRAMDRLFGNRPEKESQMALLFKAMDSGDEKAIASAERTLTRTMNPTEFKQYQGYIDEFFAEGRGVPKSIRAIYKENVLQTTAPSVEEIPEGLPDASKHSGKTFTDTETNIDYQSDGSKWVRVD